MKKVFWILTSALVLALTACGSSATPTAIPTVSLDQAAQTSASSGSASASAVVVPMQKVELAFPTLGMVKTVEVAEGDSVTSNQTLVTLDSAILESRVKEAEANVIIAQTTVTYLKRSGATVERLDAANADVERAMAAVEIAKAQLAQATLLAPTDGMIATVDISPAEVVNPGQIVIVMGDLVNFQIETTDLSEKDITSVQVGQSATIFIDALDEEFTGKVSDIARISETVGGDVVYKVTIQFDSQPEGLRWGMSADVKIETK